jgi:hypothetical protein
MSLTVGVGTVMAAREVLLIVTGQGKAPALARTIEHGVNHMYTASAIQLHPRACVVCDEDATNELRVRTVKYFKGLERVHRELLSRDDDMKGQDYSQYSSKGYSGKTGMMDPCNNLEDSSSSDVDCSATASAQMNFYNKGLALQRKRKTAMSSQQSDSANALKRRKAEAPDNKNQ